MVRKIVLSLIVVLSMTFGVFAQNKQVSGSVFDESGAPVVGATIIIEDTHAGTTTGADGSFAISAPVDGVISVSYVGYVSQSVQIAGRTKLAFVLVADATLLDDVVVVAFGTAKKEAFTGSAKVVESDEIGKVQSTSVANALIGRVSGVQTTSSSGSLGSSPSIRIRGFGSMSTTVNSEPLWVVDGVPFSGDLNLINTADIESMTVLKDAASNALYGSRGANGVIMVTTKKASRGEAKVSFDAKMGVNAKATKNYDIVDNAGEYYEMHYAALKNSRTNSGYDEAYAHQWAASNLTGNSNGGLGYNVYSVPEGEYLIGSNGKLNPNATYGNIVTGSDGTEYLLQGDDWMEEAYQTGVRQEYNVNISAANERSSFFASIGYLDNEGIIEKSSYERLTTRLKGDYQAKDWMKVGGNFSFTKYTSSSGNDEEGESGSSANVFAYTSLAPIYPVYIRDANGNIMIDEYGYQMYDYGDAANYPNSRPYLIGSNALQGAWLDEELYEGNAMSANGFADFDLTSKLRLTVNGGMSLDEYYYTSLANPYYGQFAPTGGYIYKVHDTEMNYNLQQLLNYNDSIGDHTFGVLLGHEYNVEESSYIWGVTSNIFSTDNLELSGAVVDGQSAASSKSTYNTEGYFFRGQYEYASKIYASASFRRDASSYFHPDHRWGNFWSVGAAWILSKEDFMSETSGWLDMLKYKISYGSQGNDGIGSYRYTDTYSLANNAGEIAVLFNTKGNEEITWETNANFNTGIEFSMYQGRFGGNVDYFNRKTTDMLTWFSVPTSLGYSGYYDNVGDMVNRGVEIELYADIIRTQDFTWSFDINASFIRNEITYIAEKNKTMTVDGSDGYYSGSYWYGEGCSLYTLYMRTYAGVDQATGSSMWYMDVENEDGSISKETTTNYSEADLYMQDTALPDVYGGFSTSIRYKGFDASIAFTYQIGGVVYDSGYAQYMTSPTSASVGSNYHVDLYDSWTPDNTNTDIPRFSYGDAYSASMSSRFLTDASYLNISNINVGYTLPQDLTKSIGLNMFRIYLACDNVAYWSQRQGLDPRYSFTGSTNYSNYAPIRTISGGITLEF
ncbi:MAG: SusC/RagA family TonB-linked outer membrane protein [Rikenellaceae bacterium]